MGLKKFEVDKLESYFTNMKDSRKVFNDLVISEAPPKRILIFHGLSGVGKTSLLTICYQDAKLARNSQKKITVPTMANGDKTSFINILSEWAVDMEDNGSPLTIFNDTLNRYQKIKDKIEKQTPGQSLGKKAEGTTTELLDLIMPGPGAKIGGKGVGFVTEFVNNFISKNERSLLVDIDNKLAEAFLKDISKISLNNRLILFLDNYEKISNRDKWLVNLIQHSPNNILFVLASQSIPDWKNFWTDWRLHTLIEEVEPLNNEDSNSLAQLYSKVVVGAELEISQQNAITHLSQGFPLFITSAVYLGLTKEISNIDTLIPLTVEDFVKRLIEEKIISQDIHRIIEIAGLLRWFNKDILEHILKLPVSDELYSQICRLPFVQPKLSGYTLHKSLCSVFEEYYRSIKNKHYREIHKLAQESFRKLLVNQPDNEELFFLEMFYHYFRTIPGDEVKMFQEIAEQSIISLQTNRLRTLLNDNDLLPSLPEINLIWSKLRRYYRTRLQHMELNISDSAKYGRIDELKELINIYIQISEDSQVGPKIKAYALSDLGEIYSTRWYLDQEQGSKETAIQVIKSSLSHQLDKKLVFGYWYLGDVYRRTGEVEKSEEFYLRVTAYFEGFPEDKYTELYLKIKMAIAFGYYGYFSRLYQLNPETQRILIDKSANSNLYTLLKISWTEGMGISNCWMGLLQEQELLQRQALDDIEKFKHFSIFREGMKWRLSNILGYNLSLQGRFEESTEWFEETLKVIPSSKTGIPSFSRGMILGFYGFALMKSGRFEQAQEKLRESFNIKKLHKDSAGFVELYNWLGELFERLGDNKEAEKYYSLNLSVKNIGRRYPECGAIVGLARLKFVENKFEASNLFVQKAEDIAQLYVYYDLLAILKLIQGHMEVRKNNFPAAVDFYKESLIFALSYNRFCLDEILSGALSMFVLTPIIPFCQKYGKEGQEIIQNLYDWWKTDNFRHKRSAGTTHSQISNGATLLETERIVRSFEPGNNMPQLNVLEQIIGLCQE